MAFDAASAVLVGSSGFDPSSAVLENEALRAQAAPQKDVYNQRDPDVDYATGLKNFRFRSAFSRMTNPEEQAQFLDKFLGSGNWRKDSFGAYVVEPAGLAKLGQKSDMPVALDEQTASRYDVADIVGDLPAIAGGTAVAIAASRAPGMVLPALMAAGGAMGGKGLLEVYKNLAGEQVGSSEDVAKGLLTEGALSAAGETATRLLKPVGRYLLGPEARRMTPDKEGAMEKALELGFKPRPGQVTDAPILSRWESLTKTMFGDLNEEANDAAAKAAIARLSPKSPTSMEKAGEIYRNALVTGRNKLNFEATAKYAEVDKLAGSPVIPTARLQLAAAEILESMMKTQKGKPVLVSPETVGYLKDIMDLPEMVSASNMQQARSFLSNASGAKNLTPDLSDHHLGLLREAADRTFTDAARAGTAPPAAIRALRRADEFYSTEMKRFDSQLANAIARDPGKVGAIEPGLVVDSLIKPGQAQRVARMKDAVSTKVWKKVQDAHAEKLLNAVVQYTDDPLKTVFNGRALKAALREQGDDVVTAVHGSRWAAQMNEFADALMLAQKGSASGSGGLYAAATVLNPILNLQKLAMLRGMARFLQSPGGLRYLTVGIKAPRTREGAEMLTRAALQATAIADDETGVASVVPVSPTKPGAP